MIGSSLEEPQQPAFMDRATRHVLGIDRVLELTAPDSEFARAHWYQPRCIVPEQAEARQRFTSQRAAQLRFESWWLGVPDGERQEERIRHALAQMPLDLKRVLNKVRAEEVLAESELFAIKRFLYHTQKLILIALPGFESDRPSPQEDQRTLKKLLAQLHPESTPSPRFHLCDALSDALATSRKLLTQARQGFMARRKVLVELAGKDYPGVRFDLDGVASIAGEQALRAATDPGLEPHGSMWRLRDEELDASRALVESLEREVEAHEREVRERLSQALSCHVSWLVGMFGAVTLFDLRLTRMRLRERMKGSWPMLLDEGSPRVVLHAGLSPLIEEDRETAPQPVDFDFSMQPVVITGPNMGGKSSLLRLIGLCQWCMQHGLPVPAKRYDAPLMAHVVYVGSELPESEHGALEGLSSFGREIRRLVSARQETRPVTLWLLDEVGRGTHPEDGTQLAREIIDVLEARGDHVICATHFPGLARRPGVECWRIAGLVDRQMLMAMATSSSSAGHSIPPTQEAIEALERALRAAMDYRPIRMAEGEESVPRDAHLIARLLGW